MISLTAYARHRGVSVEAVSKAIRVGRLRKCVVSVNSQPKVSDVELADEEWAANTRNRRYDIDADAAEPGMSLRAYARHRSGAGLAGGTLHAVQVAISSGRVSLSVRDGKICDVDLADREWREHTQDTAPLSGPCRGRWPKWWKILGRNLAAVARRGRRDARASKREIRARRKAEGLCAKCDLPASKTQLCEGHAAEARAYAAELTQTRKREREERLRGAVRARDIGKELGVGAERVLEWAREGLIPFETQGRKGGRRWFRIDAVKAAVGELTIINGIVYRPGSMRERSVALRASEKGGVFHTCASCQRKLLERDFPPAAVRHEKWQCRECKTPYTRASDAKRRRKMTSTRVEPIKHIVVAERDGWRCGICGGRVTRATWSIDHVIPISKNGSHTYDNVVLAHRDCNSRRSDGRLPVQASLFARF